MGKKSVERNVRLDALRREQKRKERRRALLIYGTAGAVALALLGGIITFVALDNRGKSAAREVGYVAAPTTAATAAGCTGVVNDPMRGATHVEATDTVDYEVAPPSSGNHDYDPLPDAHRFYEPTADVRPERAVHNLEHGFIVGWYDRDLPTDQVDALRKASEAAGKRFIAVPWARGSFPDGKHFVLTAWDRTQRCGSVSGAVVDEFVTKYADPDPSGASWESQTAPESGAPGGALNITPTGPIPGASVAPGPGTMSVDPTSPTGAGTGSAPDTGSAPGAGSPAGP